jgi:hypothetical protein
MKTKYFFNVVMAALIAVIFSVLTGCATSGDGEDQAALAAKLAADLNAVKAGSAEVNGGTVTLTEDIRLETVLTVPEGVTLDLTKETLQLGNGAALTVNGVVNAKAEGINIDSAAASPATINGSGTIQLKSKGLLLGIWEGKKLTLDGVTLVGLKDNDKPVVEIGNGGEFVLKSGAITGNTRVNNEGTFGGGVMVGGLFTMEGGEISGNSARGGKGGHGGGVAVGEGTFAMQGGAITGNSARGETDGAGGGGVIVERGTFTMSGGAISGNSTTGKTWSNGGGVKLADSTFTMSGGAITDNTVTSDNWAAGGGVNIEDGSTVTMSDGEISGNVITGGNQSLGGGLFVCDEGSNFTMQGGTISGNSANGKDSVGGGVNVDSCTFTMEGGTIYGKAESLPAGTDASLANSAGGGASLYVYKAAAKWGTGGTYTKGSVSQTGGGEIVPMADSDDGPTDDTLIAIP